MWLFKFLTIVALVLSSEAKPKRYHGINAKVEPKAVGDRLNGEVAPSDYALSLTLSEQDLKDGKYSGTVAITISVSKPEGVTSFQLHAREIDIQGTPTIKDKSKNEDACGTVTVNGPDLDTDFITITCGKTLSHEVTTGYVLTIDFKGTLSTTEMSGFYKSSYKNQDGSEELLATTQFEEMGARKAFPCFDEPAIKATFQVTMTYPDGYSVLSNTKPGTPTSPVNGLRTVVFEPTPSMSTYLIAFIVSKFTCTPGDNIGPNKDMPTEVCSRIQAATNRDQAKVVAPQALAAMKDYTGLDYGTMGLKKLSQAAIPDFSAGAMENWGMITYREADVLYDSQKSSNRYLQTVSTVITHELSHQWFGDYVTLNWWSDIFLNEGFASYFEYHATDVDHQSWQLQKQFVVEELQAVLLTDSTGQTYPLHYDSNDPDVIESRFDDISYNKGGTILRMVHHFLTLDIFKQGLAHYLDKGAIGQPGNLWVSFQEVLPETITLPENTNISIIMDNWINKAGYPILSVSLSDDAKEVTISQKQFLLSGDGDTQWYVPITYATNNSLEDFTKTGTKKWLVPDGDLTIDLDGAEWIVLNNQQVGYYRVDYDQKLLDRISAAFQKKLSDIDEMSRSQIADDQLNLARANKKSYGKVLAFLAEFLESETSYFVWYPTLNGFNHLLQATDNNEVRLAIKNLIKQLISKFADSAPFNVPKHDDQIYTFSQVLAWTWACQVDYSTCISDAKSKFDEYKTDETKLDANLKGIVFCNALRNSENAEEDYNFLWDKYLNSNLATDKVEMLKTIGCINDSGLRKKYLGEALTDNVKIQDNSYVWSSVYSNNPEGISDIIDFIKTNHSNFEDRFHNEQATLIGLINRVAGLITNQDQIDQLNDLSATEGLNAAVKTAVDNAATSAKKNLDVVKSLESTLREYFNLNEGNNSAVINSYHFVNLALMFVLYLWFNH